MQLPEKGHPFPPFSFAYCLSRNTLFINLLLLWWIIFFQNKTNFSFNLLLVNFAVLCICVSWGAFSYFCYHEMTFMNSFIFVYMHSYICIYFLFGFSWHNHIKNYRLLLFFFWFPRKLSSRLYYLHNFKLFISFRECK